ncbi:MAG: 3-oxoacyl-ACP reductase FabG [Victivallales bacterium]|nr:3-oxoacyl-ACP reductase FabG [Victivallales bacterium]
MSETTLVQLPKIYENMDEATMGPWAVKVGQKVAKGTPLVELITDKMVTDFEAPCDGTVLEIYALEKSTVPYGYVICAIGDDGAQAPDVKAQNDACLNEHLKQNSLGLDLAAIAAPATAKPTFKAAPAAKAFAKQQGVDLDKVAKFCGRDTIHRKDVEDYIASQKPKAEPPSAPSAQPLPAAPNTEAIEKRVALITGASGAIGSAIARTLGAQGMAIAIHCNSNAEAAEGLASELRAAGVTCEVFKADLRSSAECKELVQKVVTAWGRIDVLVNNAGRLIDATVSFMSDEQWSDSIEINLNAPFRLMREVSMVMARRRYGRIVSLASDAGRMGSANRSNYAAAKEGLVGLTRSAAREMAGLGIRVNAVSPGFVESPMTANISPAKMKDILRDIPVRRLGKPQDVANLVAFLASEGADYITGQVISIDGGLFMG